jgi:hypothetical protein
MFEFGCPMADAYKLGATGGMPVENLSPRKGSSQTRAVDRSPQILYILIGGYISAAGDGLLLQVWANNHS